MAQPLARTSSFGRRGLRLTGALLAGALLVASPAIAQDSSPRPAGDPGGPGALTVVGQVTLGTLSTPIGYFGGGLATRKVARWVGASDETARRAAYVGAVTGATVATGTTVHFLGRTGRVSGSYPAAVGGAALGGLASWGLVEFGRSRYREGVCTIVCRIIAVSAFVLPSVGATVGHAVTREWR